MEAPTVGNSIKQQIMSDLKIAFQEIINKHLDDRNYEENKVKNWISYILEDAKKYFIKKYPEYDIFLFSLIIPYNIYYRSNSTCIVEVEVDDHGFVDFNNNSIYSILRFCFFKHYNFTYHIEQFEDEIIQKGNEILEKYLDGREYNNEKADKYNFDINDEHVYFILEKEKYLRCFIINKIFQRPFFGKIYFKYLCYGKEVYRQIFQTFINNSLECYHFVFFFK
jgi:hypothetical protein